MKFKNDISKKTTTNYTNNYTCGFNNIDIHFPIPAYFAVNTFLCPMYQPPIRKKQLPTDG